MFRSQKHSPIDHGAVTLEGAEAISRVPAPIPRVRLVQGKSTGVTQIHGGTKSREAACTLSPHRHGFSL